MKRGFAQRPPCSSVKDPVKGGVGIVACQMSMDPMGVKREELVDKARIGGVATYLSEVEKGA